MKKADINCDIVGDLLPLYVEDMVSETSSEFIKEHLESCEICRKKAEEMLSSDTIEKEDFSPEVVPLEKMKRILKKRGRLRVAFVVLLMAAIFLVVFSRLTSPVYFEYSDDIVSVEPVREGVVLSFDEDVTGISVTEHSLEGETYFTVEAWYTLCDNYIGKTDFINTVIRTDSGEIPLIYYVQNNGEDDVLIYGESLASGGSMTLPRLVLGYYLIFAVGFSLLCVLLYVIFIRIKKISSVLGKIIFLPISYIVSHIAIKGFNTVTFSPVHDFAYIFITAAVIWSAVLLLQILIKESAFTVSSKTE